MKRLIKQTLIANTDILEALHNPAIDIDSPDEFLDANIYGFIRIPQTQDTVRNFICFTVDDVEEHRFNEVIKTDYEIIKEFKKEIYEIERIALIPMRECIPDMKNIEITPSAIINAKEDIIFAKNKCDEVVNIYEDMEVPKLSKVEYMDKLEQSKTNVKNAYILRGKAMDSAEKLLNTKNLKYITEIKEYLSLSDEQIKEFVDTTKELQNKVKNIE
jgi:iron uptake system EfeUOB component EfeO/EfeM